MHKQAIVVVDLNEVVMGRPATLRRRALPLSPFLAATRLTSGSTWGQAAMARTAVVQLQRQRPTVLREIMAWMLRRLATMLLLLPVARLKVSPVAAAWLTHRSLSQLKQVILLRLVFTRLLLTWWRRVLSSWPITCFFYFDLQYLSAVTISVNPRHIDD